MANSFLIQCKENYLMGITPSNKADYEKEGYKKMIIFAKEYFYRNEYKEFAAGFVDGQYLVPLWIAHMLIEHGEPKKELFDIALNTIKDYSDNPLVPEVAKEEREWLIENEYLYK